MSDGLHSVVIDLKSLRQPSQDDEPTSSKHGAQRFYKKNAATRALEAAESTLTSLTPLAYNPNTAEDTLGDGFRVISLPKVVGLNEAEAKPLHQPLDEKSDELQALRTKLFDALVDRHEWPHRRQMHKVPLKWMSSSCVPLRVVCGEDVSLRGDGEHGTVVLIASSSSPMPSTRPASPKSVVLVELPKALHEYHGTKLVIAYAPHETVGGIMDKIGKYLGKLLRCPV